MFLIDKGLWLGVHVKPATAGSMRSATVIASAGMLHDIIKACDKYVYRSLVADLRIKSAVSSVIQCVRTDSGDSPSRNARWRTMEPSPKQRALITENYKKVRELFSNDEEFPTEPETFLANCKKGDASDVISRIIGFK